MRLQTARRERCALLQIATAQTKLSRVDSDMLRIAISSIMRRRGKSRTDKLAWDSLGGVGKRSFPRSRHGRSSDRDQRCQGAWPVSEIHVTDFGGFDGVPRLG